MVFDRVNLKWRLPIPGPKIGTWGTLDDPGCVLEDLAVGFAGDVITAVYGF
jgi:hypothetical protein